MRVSRAFCLFEQSGTFKKAFLDAGIPAEDFDIRDDFGQTDHVMDLFAEIDNAYSGEKSIFDDIGQNDIVFAFFPCTRFECQSQMMLNGNKYGIQRWPDDKKLEYAIQTHKELHRLYTLLCKLVIVSIRGGWRMIIENPATQPHYLTDYFPIRPALIDKDRTQNGDYYKKPTQYWFINCKPEQNMILEALEQCETRNIERARNIDGIDRVVARSQIHPQYARRFIRSFVLD